MITFIEHENRRQQFLIPFIQCKKKADKHIRHCILSFDYQK